MVKDRIEFSLKKNQELTEKKMTEYEIKEKLAQ